jgi:hypothetical protein
VAAGSAQARTGWKFLPGKSLPSLLLTRVSYYEARAVSNTLAISGDILTGFEGRGWEGVMGGGGGYKSDRRKTWCVDSVECYNLKGKQCKFTIVCDIYNKVCYNLLSSLCGISVLLKGTVYLVISFAGLCREMCVYFIRSA